MNIRLNCFHCDKEDSQESGDRILTYAVFWLFMENEKIPTYNLFYGKKTSNMIYCAKVTIERMKKRKKF